MIMVPTLEIDKTMMERRPIEDYQTMHVVAYVGYKSYALVHAEELRLFDPNKEPYLSFKRLYPEEMEHSSCAALEQYFYNRDLPPPGRKWEAWGYAERLKLEGGITASMRKPREALFHSGSRHYRETTQVLSGSMELSPRRGAHVYSPISTLQDQDLCYARVRKRGRMNELELLMQYAKYRRPKHDTDGSYPDDPKVAFERPTEPSPEPQDMCPEAILY
ncbi:uncharacterized protein BJ171DRAFT_125929 [Polychytrium aggregatum]|uniref:uncharacterized protein n=1 Tax=Polychytrium aggregatum TaxID=110093 RepID=UPI0022FE2121|nr:uncharacterized protein BJ171DRAFT_125929 [Polychytrium aggregatum]KAI9203926.1 hypothetical protein BJ171DRAFT_125929 [Polychytrium aggregatum]